MKQLLRYFEKRQTLLTIFAVLVIIFGGVSIVDNPDQWWGPPLVIISLLIFILIFIHARVVFKVFLSLIIMSFATYFAFLAGQFDVETEGTISALWAVSITLLYFMNIALSYMMQSTRSRWTCLSIATIIQFSTTALTIDIEFIHPNISVAIGLFVGIAAFVMCYRLPVFFAYRDSRMPENIASDMLTESLREAFEKEGWKFRDVRKKGNKGGYIVFNDRAYYLHPVRMLQDLQQYKKTELRYNGKSINSWLASVAYKEIPTLRSKDAPILPVLLDTTNANGSTGKTIGISLPDTKRVIPFGIFPSRELNSNRKNKSVIVNNLDLRFKDYTESISQKQHNALEKIGSQEIVHQKEDEAESNKTKSERVREEARKMVSKKK